MLPDKVKVDTARSSVSYLYRICITKSGGSLVVLRIFFKSRRLKCASHSGSLKTYAGLQSIMQERRNAHAGQT